ncbi:branched-chain amino acid ABC transporter permease [Nitriliruptor alkaliphilus]|uniref:branched-chain amino acid ABC transporter permease n=1 Tax=Nitriliruptor alkaliphilus TaxID=427918 RepID=UPI000698D40E|nr:branched-chain amino acid ABC transporter permease [Nitriliruptor alkaliphilus]
MNAIQAAVTGLGNGATYGLIATGLVIIYKSTHVISFAQPSLMIVGGMVAYYATRLYGLPFGLALVIAALLAGALAMLIDRGTQRPLLRRSPFVMVVMTLGVDIVLRVVVNQTIGTQRRSIPNPWGFDTISVGGVIVQQRSIAMFSIGLLVMVVLAAFFRYARIGLAMRAVAFDREAAMAQGMSASLVFALSWGLAGGLAAIAGVLLGSGSGLDQQTWLVALKAIPAMIIGGLDSIKGAFIGGLAVGLVEAFFGSYQSSYMAWLGDNFAVVSGYLLLLIVLMLRPYGLFGTTRIERV